MSIVRGLLDSQGSNTRRTEGSYLAVLKGSILYLYEDEAMQKCAAVIDVRSCDVKVYPEPGLLDGELFAKRNARISDGGKSRPGTSGRPD
ncbi:hypothetical protein M422DRAFT_179837 [Sphaerobolus stellatus SS14]|uniref:Uncharacterized protein n=1 Tax=Sphaerobolus stellatus (strain SS14) TaxID=990650 RepID=A0A0C9V2W0_SPHS4|nr:hypothetical protein M422DRAFT_179837 [Sphaerobolus stellatus SS14]